MFWYVNISRLLARTSPLSVLALTAVLVPALPAHASDDSDPPAPSTFAVTLTGPASAPMRTTVRLPVTVTADVTPASAVQVRLESDHDNDGVWDHVKAATTGPDGTTVFSVSLGDLRTSRFRVTAGPDHSTVESVPHTVTGTRHTTITTLKGATKVVDEQSIVLKSRTRSRHDRRLVTSATVVLQQRQGARWVTVQKTRSKDNGRARFKVTPRTDTRFRAVTRRGGWFASSKSSARKIDNVPQISPVALPKGAPKPRITLPKQARATTAGANAVITRIPNVVWRDMRGKSWRKGCTARSNLRLIRVNYWGFDGYRYRGELVVAASVAPRMAAAFTAIYNAKLPIRSMYRVDRFGYSKALRGANDYASMAADNTSAFNCRDVVGRPGVKSPHATGRSVDINPWENPYAASFGWTPNSWWVTKSHPKVAWRSPKHRMVRILANHGIRWTYGVRDAHHFDG